MTQVKKDGRQFLKGLGLSPLLPFFVLWVILFACHLKFVMVAGDEVYYGTVLANSNLWDFSVHHYLNWSSRSLIEIVLSVFSYLPKFVWRVADPLMAVGMAVALSKVIGAEKERSVNWVLCGFILLYRWELLRTAGWIATTLVYLWPATIAVMAFVPVAKWMRGETPRKLWCALSLPALLYATNMEQVAATVTLLLLGLVAYRLFTKQTLHWVVFAQLAICLLNIAYALASPGSRARFAVDSQWFMNFGMRSVFSNAELGVSTALAPLVYARDAVFAFFCLLLCWVVWRRYKNIPYRILGVFPLVVCLLLGFYQRYTLRVFPSLSFFTQALNGEGIITLSNCNVPLAYIPFLLLCTVFWVCVVNLYLAFGHTNMSFAAIWVLCSGFASRVLLGFSPSVWASGDRTGFFFSVCTIAVACLLYRQLKGCRGWQKVGFHFLFYGYCGLQVYSIAQM